MGHGDLDISIGLYRLSQWLENVPVIDVHWESAKLEIIYTVDGLISQIWSGA